LADELNDVYRRGSFGRRIENIGLGVHFTAYELIDGRRIPELFVITNWLETWPTPYSVLSPDGFAVTRETWKTILRMIDQDCDPALYSIEQQRNHENRKAAGKALREQALMLSSTMEILSSSIR
jgi:hypothetical protein